jgi:hypothetical protein
VAIQCVNLNFVCVELQKVPQLKLSKWRNTKTNYRRTTFSDNRNGWLMSIHSCPRLSARQVDQCHSPLVYHKLMALNRFDAAEKTVDPSPSSVVITVVPMDLRRCSEVCALLVRLATQCANNDGLAVSLASSLHMIFAHSRSVTPPPTRGYLTSTFLRKVTAVRDGFAEFVIFCIYAKYYSCP